VENQEGMLEHRAAKKTPSKSFTREQYSHGCQRGCGQYFVWSAVAVLDHNRSDRLETEGAALRK
jgi:hypothetical protein